MVRARYGLSETMPNGWRALILTSGGLAFPASAPQRH